MQKQKIIFLSGMSESGKSFSGMFLEKHLNYKRIKIIQIEKELMRDYGIKLSIIPEKFNDNLKELYAQKNVYNLFLNKIFQKSKQKNIVLESLYKKELFLELKKIYKETFCIFLKADKRKRIQREFLKESQINEITLKDLKIKFEEKEKFKKKHKAHLLEKYANIIIKNNRTKKDLENKILNFIKNW